MSEASSAGGKLRLALIGCGRIARLHCDRVAADGRATIAALFDADPAAAQGLQREAAPSAVVYPSFEELLNAGSFEAAVIASPTHLHFEQATALLARKIPTLCEKPLARTRAEILGLIEQSQTAGILLSVAYQRRTWTAYCELRRLVRSGEFGPVRAVVSHNVENWQSAIGGTWRDDPRVNPGGFIGDAGSHKIDAVFNVTGLELVEVFARCDRSGSQVEITASVSAVLTGNVPLTMDFIGNGNAFQELLAIHCAGGDLVVREGELWLSRIGTLERAVPWDPAPNPISALLDSLLERTENFAPPNCALPVYDFTQALLESARSGKSVAVG